MFLLIALGFFLYKGKMIDDHTTSQLTDFLILDYPCPDYQFLYHAL